MTEPMNELMTGQTNAPMTDAAAHVFAGELVRISVSPVMGGTLSIRAGKTVVNVEGLPEATVRACAQLLFTRVQIDIRPEQVDRTADPAAVLDAIDRP